MKHITSTLTLSAAILGAAFAGSGGFSTEAGAKELKLGTFMSPKHYLNRVAFPNLGKEIAAATGGETTFKIFAGGQLGKGPVQQVKRVVSNVMDVGFGIQGNTSTIFPATMIAG